MFDELLMMLLLILPIGAIWASWKLWQWQRRFHSRFLGGLFIASVATDLASVPIAVLSGRRIWYGDDVSVLPGTPLILIAALVLLEGVFIYLVLRWRGELDRESGLVEGETQNQREDRYMGDQRRDLPSIKNAHKEEK